MTNRSPADISPATPPAPAAPPAPPALPASPVGDGIDRRGFLNCMAWVGTGVLWTMAGGVLTSCTADRAASAGGAAGASGVAPAKRGTFTFAQISDSHIGFGKEPNQDVSGTLRLAIDRINALPTPSAFALHTGDLTHMAKPDEFDACDQIVRGLRAEKTFYVPGEHDVFTDQGASYLARYGKGTRGNGWQSFDYGGVHFVGLVNVMDLKAGGLGLLGHDQLDWLKQDLAPVSSETPVVVFAHVPLWTVYAEWGWGTEDTADALAMLRRFGSVSVLNGHIHQVLQKVEGRITFHTARSTAFPQPAPGTAPSPGPMKNVAADRLRSMLGIMSVNYVERASQLAVIDATLE